MPCRSRGHDVASASGEFRAVGAEFGLQARVSLKTAALALDLPARRASSRVGVRHILAEDDHALVAPHLVLEAELMSSAIVRSAGSRSCLLGEVARVGPASSPRSTGGAGSPRGSVGKHRLHGAVARLHSSTFCSSRLMPSRRECLRAEATSACVPTGRGPAPLDLLFAAVLALVVAERVRVRPHNVAMHQRRPAPRAAIRDSLHLRGVACLGSVRQSRQVEVGEIRNQPRCFTVCCFPPESRWRTRCLRSHTARAACIARVFRTPRIRPGWSSPRRSNVDHSSPWNETS